MIFVMVKKIIIITTTSEPQIYLQHLIPPPLPSKSKSKSKSSRNSYSHQSNSIHSIDNNIIIIIIIMIYPGICKYWSSASNYHQGSSTIIGGTPLDICIGAFSGTELT
eukprot:330544_1